MTKSISTDDNEQNKFVDSPSRSGKSSAVETVSTVILKDPNGNYQEAYTNGEKEALSSSVALLNGEEFDSGIVDLNGYQYVSSEIFADQDGQITGEWYNDSGDTVMRDFNPPYVSANGLAFFAVPTLARYFKLKFLNNSGVDQSVFRLSVRLTNIPYSPQLLQVDQFLPPNSIATLNRSVISGLGTDGAYRNVGANDVGALNTSNFLLDVARGKYPSYKSSTKFGRNEDTDTSTDPEDVWNSGGTYTGQPTTGIEENVEVFSSVSDDNSVGSGARTIKIKGLDLTGNEIEEVIELNGTTPIASNRKYWRLSRALIMTSGDSGYNLGSITVRHVNTIENIFVVMSPQANQSAVAADTVPKGKSRVILSLTGQISRANGSAGSSNLRFLTRAPGEVFRAVRNVEVTTSYPYLSDLKTGIVIPELTDIKWQVFSVSDNNTICTAEFEFVDIDIAAPITGEIDNVVLLEDGSYLLLEDGNYLLLEG